MLQKAEYALNDNRLFLNFILLKMYRKQYHYEQFNAYQINKKTRLFPCKMSTYTRIREEVAKWVFLDKTDVTIISLNPLPDSNSLF